VAGKVKLNVPGGVLSKRDIYRFRAVTRAWNWLPTKLKYQPVPLTLTVSNVPSNHFISERGTYVHVRYMLSTVRLSVVCL